MGVVGAACCANYGPHQAYQINIEPLAIKEKEGERHMPRPPSLFWLPLFEHISKRMIEFCIGLRGVRSGTVTDTCLKITS